MRWALALVCALALPSAALAEDETLNDYAQIFRDHAAEVHRGIDPRGQPADVLELPGAGTIWRQRSGGDVSYDEDGSDEYLCAFLWLSIAAEYVRQCHPDGSSEKAAEFLRQVDRIAGHIGEGAVPPRSLDWMHLMMTPAAGEVTTSDCLADDELTAILDVFSDAEFRARWDEFLAAPPRLLLMSRCD